MSSRQRSRIFRGTMDSTTERGHGAQRATPHPGFILLGLWLTLLVQPQATLKTAGGLQSRPTPLSDHTTFPEHELPSAVLTQLEAIEDFALHFDHPGFYAVARFVHSHPLSPGFVEPPTEIADWRLLQEQPRAFRGRPITLTGIIAANKDPYRLPNIPELGLLSQIELTGTNQPLTATLIFTQPATDLPLGATLTVTGYFIMVRQYLDSAGRPRPALLLVAPGPSAIGQRMPTSAPPRPWVWLIIAGSGGLVAAWLWTRRTARLERTDLRTLTARRPAPESLVDDLADWAEAHPVEHEERPPPR